MAPGEGRGAAQDANDISDDDDIWRRVPGQPCPQLTYDHDEQRWRPSSAAFADSDGSDDPMSALLARDDTPARALLGRWEGWLLAAIGAGVFRLDEQILVRVPTLDDPNHVQVVGRKTKARRRHWAKVARWVNPPDLPPPAR